MLCMLHVWVVITAGRVPLTWLGITFRILLMWSTYLICDDFFNSYHIQIQPRMSDATANSFLNPVCNIFYGCFLLVSSLNDDVAQYIKSSLVSEVMLSWQNNEHLSLAVWQFVLLCLNTNTLMIKHLNLIFTTQIAPCEFAKGILIPYHNFRQFAIIKQIGKYQTVKDMICTIKRTKMSVKEY